MKTKILSLAILSLWSATSIFAQDRTTVTAHNSDISDNLDLRAVASIFGDSRDLPDFERRLNDPNTQISNLDLNGDNRVDYLRVIETVEGNVHLIIIQSVLGRDNFQDIATVEVEKDRYNRVQVQVVGDVYMYGNNYIYEPVYAYTPVIYTSFWVNHYRPYYSSWYWGYYPSFYVAWTPFPIYTYHSHIGVYINFSHHYNYVDYRRCSVAYNNYYSGRRGNWYERQNPNRSFAQRNTGYTNRRELVGGRTSMLNTRTNAVNNNTRNNAGVASSPRPTRTINGSNEIKSGANPRANGTRNTESPRSVTTQNGREVTSGSSPRSNGNGNTRTYGNAGTTESPRTYGNTRSSETPRTYGNSGNQSQRDVAAQSNSRGNENPGTYQNSGNGNPRSSVPQGNSRGSESPRSVASQGSSRGFESPRATSPSNGGQRSESQRGGSNQREFSQQRGGSSRTGGEANSRGGNRRS